MWIEVNPVLGPEWSDEQERILEALRASDGPLTAAELEGVAGFSPTRNQVRTRTAIRQMRKGHNVPIISTSKGYLLARTPEQMEHYAMRQINRAANVMGAARDAQRIAGAMKNEDM